MAVAVAVAAGVFVAVDVTVAVAGIGTTVSPVGMDIGAVAVGVTAFAFTAGVGVRVGGTRVGVAVDTGADVEDVPPDRFFDERGVGTAWYRRASTWLTSIDADDGAMLYDDATPEASPVEATARPASTTLIANSTTNT